MRACVRCAEALRLASWSSCSLLPGDVDVYAGDHNAVGRKDAEGFYQPYVGVWRSKVSNVSECRITISTKACQLSHAAPWLDALSPYPFPFPFSLLPSPLSEVCSCSLFSQTIPYTTYTQPSRPGNLL